MNRKVKSLVYSALGACIIAVAAQITIVIPITLVPITMQTLAVYFIGCIYERKTAVLSCFVYLLLGAIGLPVFAGFSAGIPALISPTGGYLVALPIMAWVINSLSHNKWLALILGTVVCYCLGTLWFMFIMKVSLVPALSLCVLPFLLGDLFKIIIAGFLVKRIKKV